MFNKVRDFLYRIPPIYYGWFFMAVGLSAIVFSLNSLAWKMPEIFSNERVIRFW